MYKTSIFQATVDSTIEKPLLNHSDGSQLTDEALKAMMVSYITIFPIFLVYFFTQFYHTTERLVREWICDRTLLCDKRDKRGYKPTSWDR